MFKKTSVSVYHVLYPPLNDCGSREMRYYVELILILNIIFSEKLTQTQKSKFQMVLILVFFKYLRNLFYKSIRKNIAFILLEEEKHIKIVNKRRPCVKL